MKLFSGRSNKPLTKKIAASLRIKVSSLEIFVFPDREKRVRVLDKVVNEDTVIVQPTSTPGDKNYMELFFITDALRRSGAKSIIAVIPYLGYQRQDHLFRDGEAVSLEVIVETLQAVGISKIISFDMHSVKIPSLSKIPIIHLSALPLFAKKIKEMPKKETILIAPDKGGLRRVKILSELLGGMPFGSIEKNRNLATGKVSAKKMEGDVKGKRAIIVDDMISTGGTISTAANLLLEKGATEIYVFATHPVFPNGAKETLEKVKAKKIFVTDSILVPEDKKFESLEIISIADLIAEAIR